MVVQDLPALPSLVRRAAAEFGDAPALLRAGRPADVWSFTGLHNAMSCGAANLRAAGVSDGDPVLLLLEGCPEWAAALFGIWEAGLVAVPLAADTPPGSIAAVASRTQCRIAICSERTEPLLAKAGPIKRVRVDRLFAEGTAPAGRPEASRSDLALLAFTSGSTQQPKAAELTHGNLLSDLESTLAVRDEGPGLAMLSMLPPAHLFEMMAGLLAPLATGGRIVYAGSLLPNRLIDAIREHRITHALAVPALVDCLYGEVLGRLLEAGVIGPEREREPREHTAQRIREEIGAEALRQLQDQVRQRIGDSFRNLVIGGAAIDPALAELISLVGIRVEVGYGLTEASPVVAVGVVGGCPCGSVGRPLPGIQVRIHEAGEILVRGPNVMHGYYRDHEATTDAFLASDSSEPAAWLRTGDCGRLDENGYLFVVGRLKEAIVTAAGRTVYPEEVEPYYRHHWFAEVCVAGVRGEHGNDVPVLFVVSASDAITDEQLQRAFVQLRANAPAPFRLEELVRRHEPFPRTASGKIRRRLVAEQAS